MNVSFTSTYRIPLVEQHMNQSKREALKKMASKYQNVLFPQGNQGYVRVSIRKKLDDGFEKKLREIGVRIYQKFDRHNCPKSEFENSGVSKLDLYIKEQLELGNYQQIGKQKAPGRR